MSNLLNQREDLPASPAYADGPAGNIRKRLEADIRLIIIPQACHSHPVLRSIPH
ncbi:hypothetical protein TRKP33_p0044 (plasmid) [Klebsiella pneumoniae]|uniref:Uncharacterized protein n=1 Tax=Klebsiella pneumoniae subsp. pneumoniae TaxID=72407 RepID=A0A8F7KMS8_KLEPN|nr:hypothetical protein [Klebsiella pneumoniae]QXV89277.1 hypothetical protein [Klebsiella pneumoniae subsp. pneumoniae]QVI02983.1 hypothetical protein [Klebsiella pneumoniae]QXV89825.1 hypothetical protein [Klebsiella pneumoniae subsp. pneumoniae]QXV90173.1 hypothetical protein [Klebsiella pneumoniae subsp. pneumoniae]